MASKRISETTAQAVREFINNNQTQQTKGTNKTYVEEHVLLFFGLALQSLHLELESTGPDKLSGHLIKVFLLCRVQLPLR